MSCCDWYLPLALSSLWPLTWWHLTITFQNKDNNGGFFFFFFAEGFLILDSESQRLVPFFRSTLRNKRMSSLSWGMHGYLMRLTPPLQQKRMIFFLQFFPKSLETKDERKSRLGQSTFVLCLFPCPNRAVLCSLHLRVSCSTFTLYTLHPRNTNFLSVPWTCYALKFSAWKIFLPLHLKAPPHPDFCLLITSSRKSSLISLTRSVLLSQTLHPHEALF